MKPGDGEAGDLLVHYMRTAWERAGVNWDSDNATEVRAIVDLIHEAAVREAVREALAAVNPAALV